MNLQIFLVHGFRSHSTFMKSFTEEYKNNEIHFKTDVHNHNWYAGTIESTLETGLGLIFGRYNYAEQCHELWDEALANIDSSSDELYKKVNDSIGNNGDVLLVGHSMGVEVIRRSITKIRKDINIYLFLMSGVSNDTEYDDVLNMDNVRLGYSFYSDQDTILNDILPNMNGDFVTPIGSYRCFHDKLKEIQTNQGHSYCLNSKFVLEHYTNLVKALVNKGTGNSLYFE